MELTWREIDPGMFACIDFSWFVFLLTQHVQIMYRYYGWTGGGGGGGLEHISAIDRRVLLPMVHDNMYNLLQLFYDL